MDSDAPNAYDQHAYIGRAYPETHPDRLAAIATLYGLTPPPVGKCHVLEIGCGDAANLLPQAYTLPESEFLGIDLAETAIDKGRAQATALGLRNLRLEAMNILDFPSDAGQFDYIVAHGVYSWTPPVVRDEVLAICGRHLTPHGVAFVSFNALPGCHIREMERRMMLYHLDRVGGGNKEQQARQAISLLGFLSDAQPDDNVYKKLLADAVENIGQRLGTTAGVAWFHHDILAEINQPFYLHEFVDNATGHGLQFLSEAIFRLVRSARYPAIVETTLRELGNDPVAQEQYIDFISCAPFRRVLLCRAEAKLDRSLDPARAASLYVNGDLKPKEETAPVGNDPHAPERFQANNGEITLNHPLTKAAARLLGQAWPHGYLLPDLLSEARAATGTTGGTAEELGQLLITLYGGGIVEFFTRPPASTLQISERPEASALVRLQIESSPVITSLRHRDGALEGAYIRRFVGLLDGTHNRADILRELRHWIESGEAARECGKTVKTDGTSEPVPTPESLETAYDETLERLARLEMLVR